MCFMVLTITAQPPSHQDALLSGFFFYRSYSFSPTTILWPEPYIGGAEEMVGWVDPTVEIFLILNLSPNFVKDRSLRFTLLTCGCLLYFTSILLQKLPNLFDLPFFMRLESSGFRKHPFEFPSLPGLNQVFSLIRPAFSIDKPVLI